MSTHLEVVSAMAVSEKIASVDALDGRIKAIDDLDGVVISVLPHPYETDGYGPKLIIVWRDK